MIYAAKGWVGRDYLNVQLGQKDKNGMADATFGPAQRQVHIEESLDRAEIKGLIKSDTRKIPIDIKVSHESDGITQYEGLVGWESSPGWGVAVTEIPEKDGSQLLVGHYGDTSFELTRREVGTGTYAYTGTRHNKAGNDVVHVTLTGDGARSDAPLDLMVPLLAMA